MTALQDAILDALEDAGHERNANRHAELFWNSLSERTAPAIVKDREVAQEIDWLFSRKAA